MKSLTDYAPGLDRTAATWNWSTRSIRKEVCIGRGKGSAKGARATRGSISYPSAFLSASDAVAAGRHLTGCSLSRQPCHNLLLASYRCRKNLRASNPSGRAHRFIRPRCVMRGLFLSCGVVHLFFLLRGRLFFFYVAFSLFVVIKLSDRMLTSDFLSHLSEMTTFEQGPQYWVLGV